MKLNNKQIILLGLAVVIALGAAGYGIYHMNSHGHEQSARVGKETPTKHLAWETHYGELKQNDEDSSHPNYYTEYTQPEAESKRMLKDWNYNSKHFTPKQVYDEDFNLSDMKEKGLGVRLDSMYIILYKSGCKECAKYENDITRLAASAEEEAPVFAIDLRDGVPTWFKQSIPEQSDIKTGGVYKTPTVIRIDNLGMMSSNKWVREVNKAVGQQTTDVNFWTGVYWDNKFVKEYGRDNLPDRSDY